MSGQSSMWSRPSNPRFEPTDASVPLSGSLVASLLGRGSSAAFGTTVWLTSLT